MSGEFLKVPLLDDDGNVAWPGMFPSLKEVEKLRRDAGDDIAWKREYLLKPLPDSHPLVTLEDIHHYDAKPQVGYGIDGNYINVIHGTKGVGVDLAISKKDSADYTAMVSGQAIFENDTPKIYIDPHPFNGKIDFRETIEHATAMAKSSGEFPQFFVENVAYQQAAVEEFRRNGLAVRPMQALQDKRARLSVVAMYIKNGIVLFPREGCKDLINQLIYFGSESHDDLVDALVYLILGIKDSMELPKVVGLL